METEVRHQCPGTLKKYGIFYPNRPLHDRKRRAGFTLLEVMIALAIIGITLVVVLHTVNHHAEIMYQNTITTQMYQMAKEKMFELEKNHANAKGSLGQAYTFENRITRLEDSEVLELKTTVTGQGKEVSLTELVLKEKDVVSSQ
jgi:prepilin-type N-terminal cleavage/methylation domain-containing protein